MSYLEYAKGWAQASGAECIDGDMSPEECLTKAQTCALVSIAGSLEAFAVKSPESVTVELSVLKEMAERVARIELLSDWDETNWTSEKRPVSLINAIHYHTCNVADILEELTGEAFPRNTFTSPVEDTQCE